MTLRGDDASAIVHLPPVSRRRPGRRPAGARQRHPAGAGRRGPGPPRRRGRARDCHAHQGRLARLLAQSRRRRLADAGAMDSAARRHPRAAALPGPRAADHRRADELCLQWRPCHPAAPESSAGRGRDHPDPRRGAMAGLHRQDLRARARPLRARRAGWRRRRDQPRPLRPVAPPAAATLVEPGPLRYIRRQAAPRHPAPRQRQLKRTLCLPARRRAGRLCRAAELPPLRRHADR